MFAIFETGGKQYKSFVGDKLKIERLSFSEGEKVLFKEVLLLANDDKVEVGTHFVNVVVEAKILSHGRSSKIRIVKHKAKKRYSKVQGHRQNYTEIEITKIGTTTKSIKTKPKAEVKPKAKTKSSVDKKPAVAKKKTAATKKTVTKKTAVVKKS